ncbi:FAD/NAD(P)-binding domain-containing protein [Rhizodiscina lignyota]|uniref:FAD/NAD(P)-binding domain-containing protein n=1 Tax=Rhizodiscina lignyota TaxID=1504668 RepID=A0A9P4IKQ5_9PEZI|nr:FAD/NAD(P)-binding domain-containing protein [Rhizodiscina lignyota]
MATEVDVLIIGAGLYGIQAARTYLEIHPNAKLAILEASSYLGGVWSKERVYDSFRTQISIDFAHFSDVPLSVDREDSYNGFVYAGHVTSYNEDYVRSHVYNGTSILDRIKFDSRVQTLRKHNDQWIATVDGTSSTYTAAKVIDASGITSKPVIPKIPGQSNFRGVQIHNKDYAKSDILKDDAIERIAVIGGAKSAADMAYAAAKANKTVYWIIRKSGSGPAAFANPVANGPFKSGDDALLTRLLFPILVSKFVETGIVANFFNGTAFGRRILKAIWQFLESHLKKNAKYDRPDPHHNGFKNLKPDTSLFWQNDSTGVQQSDDFYDTLAERVKIIRDDTAGFEEKALRLVDGQKVEVDAVVYATGWDQAAPPYFETETAAALGLPVPYDSVDEKQQEKWKSLEAEADKAVLKRFPILANPPPYHKKKPKVTPYRLCNCILPVNDSSIVFLGRPVLLNAWRMAEVQSLWATAVLDGKLEVPMDKMEIDVAETVVWCRRRYLTKGQLANWFFWDQVAYTDSLLKELGLKSHLGKGNILTPTYASDLKGLLKEFEQKYYGEKKLEE